MKKIITLCLMLVMSVGAFAQSNPKTENAKKAHERVSKWEQPLNLTLEQKKKAKQIMLDKFDRRDKVVAQFNIDKNEANKKAEMDQIKADTKTEMKAILDATQYEKWEKMFDKTGK